KIKEFLGDIYDFIESRNIQHLSDLELARKASSSSQGSNSSDNKLQWERRKEQEKELRKIQNQIARCEKRMAELEEEIKKGELIISNPGDQPAGFNNDEFFKNYTSLKTELQTRESEWEGLQLKLEEMEDKP
ncbi:MAG: hypothetical protein EA361_00685, partial [Bacteroidetes bacterium]